MQPLLQRNNKQTHYSTPEGIDKAAMAAMVAIKPKVVQKFRNTKRMRSEKSHNFAPYSISE